VPLFEELRHVPAVRENLPVSDAIRMSMSIQSWMHIRAIYERARQDFLAAVEAEIGASVDGGETFGEMEWMTSPPPNKNGVEPSV
jgi:hypothetical protein